MGTSQAKSSSAAERVVDDETVVTLNSSSNRTSPKRGAPPHLTPTPSGFGGGGPRRGMSEEDLGARRKRKKVGSSSYGHHDDDHDHDVDAVVSNRRTMDLLEDTSARMHAERVAEQKAMKEEQEADENSDADSLVNGRSSSMVATPTAAAGSAIPDDQVVASSRYESSNKKRPALALNRRAAQNKELLYQNDEDEADESESKEFFSSSSRAKKNQKGSKKSGYVDPVTAEGKLSAPMPNDEVVTNVATGEALNREDYERDAGSSNTNTSDFTILRDQKIGSGGFGVVFKGFDAINGTHIAVKESKASSSNYLDDPDSIKAEFNVLTMLEHDNIVKVHSFEMDMVREVSRIYMEWMPGGSVQQVIKNTNFRLHENVIRRYLRHSLQGLEYCHKKRIFHRDVKPANMLVDGNGVVKLSDFGTSKVGGSTATGTGAVGTCAYMAPEVITKGKHSAASDLWALGCSVVEMATGKPPWSELPRAQLAPIPLMFHIGSAQPPNHCPAIPEYLSKELKKVLRFLMAPEATERVCAARCLTAPYFTRNLLPNDAEPLGVYRQHLEDFRHSTAASPNNGEDIQQQQQGQKFKMDINPASQSNSVISSGLTGGISHSFGGATGNLDTADLAGLTFSSVTPATDSGVASNHVPVTSSPVAPLPEMQVDEDEMEFGMEAVD